MSVPATEDMLMTTPPFPPLLTDMCSIAVLVPSITAFYRAGEEEESRLELSTSLVPRLSGGDSIATPAFQHPRIIKSPPESLGTRLVVKLRDSSSSPAL